jgi:hypothetical protein
MKQSLENRGQQDGTEPQTSIAGISRPLGPSSIYQHRHSGGDTPNVTNFRVEIVKARLRAPANRGAAENSWFQPVVLMQTL